MSWQKREIRQRILLSCCLGFYGNYKEVFYWEKNVLQLFDFDSSNPVTKS